MGLYRRQVAASGRQQAAGGGVHVSTISIFSTYSEFQDRDIWSLHKLHVDGNMLINSRVHRTALHVYVFDSFRVHALDLSFRHCQRYQNANIRIKILSFLQNAAINTLPLAMTTQNRGGVMAT